MTKTVLLEIEGNDDKITELYNSLMNQAVLHCSEKDLSLRSAVIVPTDRIEIQDES